MVFSLWFLAYGFFAEILYFKALHWRVGDPPNWDILNEEISQGLKILWRTPFNYWTIHNNTYVRV